MVEIIGVRFKNVGKTYYFDPDGGAFTKNQRVIVETTRGMECGEVIVPNRMVPDEECTQPLKKVIRAATGEDLQQLDRNRQREEHAFQVCAEKIRKHKLEMKLISAEYTFDNNKILFYFTAEGRVDFRELVKDLASVLKTRIELRQIGVRDEAKMLGGLGICGRPFCCSTFLGEFQPVSIKMAKEQGLSLNPTKISGTCGRLMCCLKYEQNAYEHLLKTTPRQGTPVETPEGRGVISEVSLMTGMLKVTLDSSLNGAITVFHKDDVTPLGKGERRPPRQQEGQQTRKPESQKESRPAEPKEGREPREQKEVRQERQSQPRPKNEESVSREGANPPREGAPKKQGGNRPHRRRRPNRNPNREGQAGGKQ